MTEGYRIQIHDAVEVVGNELAQTSDDLSLEEAAFIAAKVEINRQKGKKIKKPQAEIIHRTSF